MLWETVGTQTASRNLVSNATVYSGIVSESDSWFRLRVKFSGLAGIGGDYTFSLLIDGVLVGGGGEDYALGVQTSAIYQTNEFFAPAGVTLQLKVQSPNAGDTAVTTAATLFSMTDVSAIKAKTDNLPSDPADASVIAASFATVNSTLSTISGYIDTEVAAIKAKTDLIGTVTGYVDAAPTNIKLKVGSTKSKSHTVTGNLTGKTLLLCIETLPGVAFATINATGGDGTFSFTPTSGLVASVKTYFASLREPIDGNYSHWDGLIEVAYAADAE